MLNQPNEGLDHAYRMIAFPVDRGQPVELQWFELPAVEAPD